MTSLKLVLVILTILLISYFISLKGDSKEGLTLGKSQSSHNLPSTKVIGKDEIAPLHKDITQPQNKDPSLNKSTMHKEIAQTPNNDSSVNKYKEQSNSRFSHEDFLKKMTLEDFKEALKKSQRLTYYPFTAGLYFSGNYQGFLKNNDGVDTVFKLQLGVGKNLRFSDRDCFALYEDGYKTVYGSVQDGNFRVFQLEEPHHIAFRVENYVVEGYAEFPHSRNQTKMIFRVYIAEDNELRLVGVPRLTVFPRGVAWDDTCATGDIIKRRR